jgi:hypothetical protein
MSRLANRQFEGTLSKPVKIINEPGMENGCGEHARNPFSINKRKRSKNLSISYIFPIIIGYNQSDIIFNMASSKGV